MSRNTGVALVFAGFVLLSIWRVLLITHLGVGMKVFTFLVGVSLCTLGAVIVKRYRKS
jgi:hypothetical protein